MTFLRPRIMTDVAGGISEEVVLRFPVTASIECQEAPQKCRAETREVTHQENDSCTWTAVETRVEPPPRNNAQSHEDSRNDQGGRDGDPAWSASPRAVDSKGVSSASVTTTNQTETVKTDDKKKKKNDEESRRKSSPEISGRRDGARTKRTGETLTTPSLTGTSNVLAHLRDQF